MSNVPISNLPVALTLSNGDVSPWVVSGTTSKLSWSTLQTLIQAIPGFGPIPAGTVMVFFQAAAPTGWTQVVTQNDKVLRVVSGAGAGTGGSWTISGISVDGHTLTEAEMPVHAHAVGSNLNIQVGSGGSAMMAGAPDVHVTTTAGGGGSHSHTMTIGSAWRPAYVDVIICSKD